MGSKVRDLQAHFHGCIPNLPGLATLAGLKLDLLILNMLYALHWNDAAISLTLSLNLILVGSPGWDSHALWIH